MAKVTTNKPNIQIKRVYEPPARGDGCRVLVDRVWPRGVRKDAAALDAWIKDVAPSTELRKWFGHDPERWPEFKQRYEAELDEKPEAVHAVLEARESKKKLTLLYGAKDEEHNNAVVLAEYLER